MRLLCLNYKYLKLNLGILKLSNFLHFDCKNFLYDFSYMYMEINIELSKKKNEDYYGEQKSLCSQIRDTIIERSLICSTSIFQMSVDILIQHK